MNINPFAVLAGRSRLFVYFDARFGKGRDFRGERHENPFLLDGIIDPVLSVNREKDPRNHGPWENEA